KLARIRSGQYKRTDFIIADAKDGDMGPSLTSSAPLRQPDGTWTRYGSRAEFLDQIAGIVQQDIVDIMLVSASNLELLNEREVFHNSAVKPSVSADRHTDRGIVALHIGVYWITFNNDIEADVRSLEHFSVFRADAVAHGFKYFLEVFNPNVDTGIDPKLVPHYINDVILRCLAGVTKAERPQFLKIAYNGPKALEELPSFDPSLVVGVLGGGAGTTRDCFELIYQAERYGARVALFGRKINLAENPLTMVAFMRQVAEGTIAPAEAVKAYHGELQKQKIKPARSLDE